MKIVYILLCSLIVANCCRAQETTPAKSKLWDYVNERFNVLMSNKNIKHGMYQALRGKVAVASGMYKQNKRVGMWHFYNHKGTLVQNFDYDKMSLNYLLPDSSLNATFSYDRTITDSTKVTMPVRIGGDYYGYLPYLAMFHMPKELKNDDYQLYKCTLQLLVSPGGRLAEYKFTIAYGEFSTSFIFNIAEMDPYDTIFLPATVNGENVACTISIPCRIKLNQELELVPWL